MKNRKKIILAGVAVAMLATLLNTGCTGPSSKDEEQQRDETSQTNQDVTDVTIEGVLALEKTADASWLMQFKMSEEIKGIDYQTIYKGLILEVQSGEMVYTYSDMDAMRGSSGRLAVEIPYDHLLPGANLNNGDYVLRIKACRLQSEEANYRIIEDFSLKHIMGAKWSSDLEAQKQVNEGGKPLEITGVSKIMYEPEGGDPSYPRWYMDLVCSETVSGQQWNVNYTGLRMLLDNGTKVTEYAIGSNASNKTYVMPGPNGVMTLLIHETVLPDIDKIQTSGNWTLTLKKGVISSSAGTYRLIKDYTFQFDGETWVLICE